MENTSKDTDKITVSYTRREIFDLLKGKFSDDLDAQINTIENHANENSDGDNLKFHKDEVANLKKLLSKIKSRWSESHFVIKAFFNKNNDWLNNTVSIVCTRVIRTDATKSNKSGRPSTSFEDSSDRTKRRKTTKIREDFSKEELAYATQMSLRSSGAVDAAAILKEVITQSPARASKYRTAYKSSLTSAPIEMTGDEALVDIVGAKLTKQNYLDIRSSLRRKNFNAYPSYRKIVEAKARCYPQDITVSEISAEVKLQSLLNHTCDRILMVQTDVINSLDVEVVKNLRLICKWGCDGSSGQSEYKQKFTSDDSSDSHMFLTSLVPLQILGFDENLKKNVVIWKNPKPSSTRFCRPIHIQFIKETVESTLSEKQNIDNQIASLQPFNTVINGQEIKINFKMYFTMIDMKVCNAVTNTTSAMRCYLCKATSSQFNDINAMKTKEIDESALGFGLSTLHAWMRCMEFFLHVGYKMQTKTWQARKSDKIIIEERKRVIQGAFKNQLELIIDTPKVGSGNSNDGNTARRFFENYDVSARILGVDSDLMKRVYVILQVMSSGFAVNVNAFQQYSFETAEICVSLYPWYCMSTTVHKVFIHGAVIIDWSPLPIGQMSEDAQEARNKDIRNYREHFARKSSRTTTMQDVFNRLLVISDPFISSKEKKHPKSRKQLSVEVTQLLIGTENEGRLYGLRNYENSSTDESTDMEDD
ncbi:uncharacterized protein LOC122509098 [Leptopilina heterotoma]|uniref:uncharacterized protein LOC122509098 n=1 Tax=Leptopilina heterotoma TaxID=63436 RepID=UPI001CA8F555|nr:uncharacterized protein LOC122509098 [Leptopilina heterotoma]